MKGMKGRYCFLVTCIWIIVWSTMVYKLDGNYPTDYMIWFLIVGIVGCFIPWVFADEDFYESEEQREARLKYKQNQAEKKP